MPETAKPPPILMAKALPKKTPSRKSRTADSSKGISLSSHHNHHGLHFVAHREVGSRWGLAAPGCTVRVPRVQPPGGGPRALGRGASLEARRPRGNLPAKERPGLLWLGLGDPTHLLSSVSKGRGHGLASTHLLVKKVVFHDERLKTFAQS